jgi:hypothetical protein
MDAQENCTVAFRTDTVGKVFIVNAGNTQVPHLQPSIHSASIRSTRERGVPAGEATIAG